MKVKIGFWVFVSILLICGGFSVSAQQNSAPASIIWDHYATGARNFIAGTIPDADITRIVQAGIRAPSAANRQPWRFTVVQNAALAKKIVPQNMDGNVIIVISAQGDGKTNGSQIFDCGLAIQSMYLAAQAMGYGSRIYTGPIDSLNKNLKTDLSLPDGSNAVALVRIGKVNANPPDAVSAASSRKDAADLVTYKK